VNAITPKNGWLSAQDIHSHMIPDDDIHTAPTRLICLENTMNGVISPLKNIQ